MTRFRTRHVTTYRYDGGATLCTNLAHLRPRDTPTQRVHAAEVIVDPEPDDRSDTLDGFGNHRTFFTVERPHDLLTIEARAEIEVHPAGPPAAAHEPWEVARDAPLDPVDELVFTLPSRLVPELAHVAKLAERCFSPGRELLESVGDLTTQIFQEWSYDPTATTVATPLADVVAARRGVCQDFAHLAVGCLRSVGLAARYVSGYLETVPPPGQPRMVGADASHAWASVRCPDGTWLDLDPTNDLVAPSTHLTVAWGRDYADVVPVKGVVLTPAGDTHLSVSVDVARVEPPPVSGDVLG